MKARTFKEYLKYRVFCLVHIFSGIEAFGLGEALTLQAPTRGMTVTHVSIDKGRDGSDLLAPEPFQTLLCRAHRHKFDASHGGPMCSSFSGVRFLPDGPPPVRDAYNLFGLPGNSIKQQAEADRGTEMANQTVEMSNAVLESAKYRCVEGVATIEQPAPRPDKPRTPSMWYLPVMKEWMQKWGGGGYKSANITLAHMVHHFINHNGGPEF